LIKKINYLGKHIVITENEISERLSLGQINLPPLSMQLAVQESKSKAYRADAVAWGSWPGGREKFAVEFKAISTPKIIRAAMDRVKATAREMGLNPLIVVPYLNDEALQKLEKEAISGIDLCGNGVVTLPDRLLICRTGSPNLFLRSGAIKNIYRRNSALTARMLLVQQRFERVSDILDQISRRNILAGWLRQPMSLSTVSKALKSLEDDMIIGRENASVILLQPEKLLTKLAENYTVPERDVVVRWHLPDSSQGEINSDTLIKAFGNPIPAVMSGVSSVSRYAVMQAGDTLAVYCPDPEGWLKEIQGEQDDRFPNLLVIKTREASVFFDARLFKGIAWASPLQTYLELMTGDKRDQETASQVKEVILSELKAPKI
jgi:DNA-binding HxlR family transcriptional regulator